MDITPRRRGSGGQGNSPSRSRAQPRAHVRRVLCGALCTSEDIRSAIAQAHRRKHLCAVSAQPPTVPPKPVPSASAEPLPVEVKPWRVPELAEIDQRDGAEIIRDYRSRPMEGNRESSQIQNPTTLDEAKPSRRGQRGVIMCQCGGRDQTGKAQRASTGADERRHLCAVSGAQEQESIRRG